MPHQNVGVDGCRAGWVAITRDQNGLRYALFKDIQEVMTTYAGAARIFVDVPIGLPWKSVPVRPCDRMARALLGPPRASSVFPVPCRKAVHARGAIEASRLNVGILRRRLSRQTEGIRAKIAEVDGLLLERGSSATTA